jgi:hypothetical protein
MAAVCRKLDKFGFLMFIRDGVNTAHLNVLFYRGERRQHVSYLTDISI